MTINEAGTTKVFDPVDSPFPESLAPTDAWVSAWEGFKRSFVNGEDLNFGIFAWDSCPNLGSSSKTIFCNYILEQPLHLPTQGNNSVIAMDKNLNGEPIATKIGQCSTRVGAPSKKIRERCVILRGGWPES